MLRGYAIPCAVPEFRFSADDQFLLNLAHRLDEAPALIHRQVEQELVSTLSSVLDRQFATATDPYGVPYLPPKYATNPPMVRTGALRRGLGVRVASGWGGITVTVTSDQEYARYLQTGTRRMEARRIVPGATMLAAVWREAAIAAYVAAFKRWIG